MNQWSLVEYNCRYFHCNISDDSDGSMIPLSVQLSTYLTNEMFRTLYVPLSDKANRHCMVSAGLAVGSGMFNLTSPTEETFTVIYPMIPMAARYHGQSNGPTYLTNRSLYVRLSDKANQHCILSAKLAVGFGTFGITSQLSDTHL